MIHLDHNATTPVLPEVFEQMRPWFVERFANPSSRSDGGAREAIQRARTHVAALIGANADEIVFTSGGTEANNLALWGSRPSRLVIGAVEHPAITEVAAVLPNCTVQRLDIDARGINHGEVPEGTDLVSVMLANNETGIVQPIAELSASARAVGSRFHTDAAQAVGKIPVSVDELGVDLLTIAGHKLYAPKGIGVLYVRRGTPLQPFMRGGGHENGRRPGTENVPGIVGLGAACAIALRDLEVESLRQSTLRDRLWARLEKRGALRTGEGRRLPNTLHVRFPGLSGNRILARCPNIAAGTGSACHSGHDTPSPVLVAMGVKHPLGALRLTVGRSTTAEQIDCAATEIEAALGDE